MKKLLILLVASIALSSCSLLKQSQKEPTIVISDQQLEELINESVAQLVNNEWLSDFEDAMGERPVLMMSQFNSEPHFQFNREKAYSQIDLKLIKTGKVRVVKPDEIQRQTNPVDLSKGESVDFTLSASFINSKDKNQIKTVFQLMIWNDESLMPLAVIEKSIK